MVSDGGGRNTTQAPVVTLLSAQSSGGRPSGGEDVKTLGLQGPQRFDSEKQRRLEAIKSEKPFHGSRTLSSNRPSGQYTLRSFSEKSTLSQAVDEPYFGYGYGFTWWMFAMVLGICIGCVNIIFHGAYHYVEDSYVLFNERVFNTDEDRSFADAFGYHACRAVGVLLSSIFVGTIVAYLCAGGGTISVRACIALGSFVPAHVGVARFVLSAVYIGFGNPLGAEAPTLHICSAVSCRDSNMYTTLITTASLIACVTTQLVVKGKFYATCDPLPRDAVDGEVLWWLLFAIPLGLFAAYVPVVFSEAVLYLRARLRRVGIVKQMIFSGLMTTLLGTLCYEVTRLLLTEKELCPKQNSCAAPTTGRLMLEDESLLAPLLVCSIIFFACKFIACLTAVACGGSGGIFAPALVLGAALGSFYGGVVAYIFNDTYYRLLFVPVGMAAVFSSMIRLPLTSVVIVFEMTSVAGSQDSSKLVFPMLLCAMVSYFVNVEVQSATMWDRLMEQDNIDPRSLQQYLNAALENPIMSRRSLRASISAEQAFHQQQAGGTGGTGAVGAGVPLTGSPSNFANRVSMSRGMGNAFNLERFSLTRGSLAANGFVRRDNSQLSSASSVLPRNFTETNMDGGMHQDMVRKALERIVLPNKIDKSLSVGKNSHGGSSGSGGSGVGSVAGAASGSGGGLAAAPARSTPGQQTAGGQPQDGVPTSTAGGGEQQATTNGGSYSYMGWGGTPFSGRSHSQGPSRRVTLQRLSLAFGSQTRMRKPEVDQIMAATGLMLGCADVPDDTGSRDSRLENN
eukprot:g4034.t1